MLDGDGYRITGTKIFITWGEHGMTENILHMVLARLPDAPAGSAGISLFAVPKLLAGGSRNGVACVSLEHKLGIHASPTCVMQFEGALGEMVGRPHRGLPSMFAMMTAEAVVERSLRALDRGRPLRVIPGWHNRAVASTQRFLPRRLVRAVSAGLFRPPKGG